MLTALMCSGRDRPCQLWTAVLGTPLSPDSWLYYKFFFHVAPQINDWQKLSQKCRLSGMCLKMLAAFCHGLSGQLDWVNLPATLFFTFTANQKSDIVLRRMVELDEDEVWQVRRMFLKFILFKTQIPGPYSETFWLSEFSSISTYNKCPGDANTAGVGTHFKQHWPRSLILRKLSETMELHFRNKTHQNVASLVEGDKAMLMWPTVQFDPDYPSFSAEILVSQKTTQSQANWKVDPLTRHARQAYHGSFIMLWSNWCFA